MLSLGGPRRFCAGHDTGDARRTLGDLRWWERHTKAALTAAAAPAGVRALTASAAGRARLTCGREAIDWPTALWWARVAEAPAKTVVPPPRESNCYYSLGGNGGGGGGATGGSGANSGYGAFAGSGGTGGTQSRGGKGGAGGGSDCGGFKGRRGKGGAGGERESFKSPCGSAASEVAVEAATTAEVAAAPAVRPRPSAYGARPGAGVEAHPSPRARAQVRMTTGTSSGDGVIEITW